MYTFEAQREKTSSVEYMLNVGETSSTTTTIQWTYDADGRLVNENYNDGVTADDYDNHYDYDAAGNRTVEYFNWTDQYHYGSRNTYTYKADGQLSSETDGIAYLDSVPVTTSINYDYDNNGSLTETDSTNESTQAVTTTTYGYDDRNRLVWMNNSAGSYTYTYSDNGDRVKEVSPTLLSNYVVDDNNPTGYSQVLEVWTSPVARQIGGGGGNTNSVGGGGGIHLNSSPAITYELGLAVLSQTITGTGAGTEYILPDGHGSTRQLTAYTTSSGTNGLVVARYDYDGFGNSIVIGTSANTASTMILYTGQMWDAGLGEYDLRLRYYDPGVGRFSSLDPTDIAASDVGDLNKYLYAGANPISYDDPSGHEESLVGQLGVTGLQVGLLGLGLVAFGALQYAASHTAAAASATSAAISDIEDWISSGASALEAEGNKLLGRAADVAKAIDAAIDEALAAGRATLSTLSKLKIFPIVESAGPAIYKFDVGALATNRAWYVLNYNGLTPSGLLRTAANRAYVFGRYGTVPAPTGEQLDEFPYASTQQGGAGGPFGPALGTYVPAGQNSLQGTLLFLFYHYELSWGTGPFLVVPIPV